MVVPGSLASTLVWTALPHSGRMNSSSRPSLQTKSTSGPQHLPHPSLCPKRSPSKPTTRSFRTYVRLRSTLMNSWARTTSRCCITKGTESRTSKNLRRRQMHGHSSSSSLRFTNLLGVLESHMRARRRASSNWGGPKCSVARVLRARHGSTR